MKNYLLGILGLVMLVGCANSGRKVIQRIDEVSDKPSWASIQKPVYTKKGKRYVVGYAQASETANISLLSEIAFNNAKNRIAKEIETEFLSVFQNISEGVEDSDRYVKKYASEKSKVYLRDVKAEDIYFEKVLYYKNKGEDNESDYIKTEMYVLISIDNTKLAQLKREVKSKFKELKHKNLKDKLDTQFEDLVEDKE